MDLDSKWLKCIQIPFLTEGGFMLQVEIALEGQNWVILPKTNWNSFETNSYDQNWTKVPKISWNSFKLIGFRLKVAKMHTNPIFDHFMLREGQDLYYPELSLYYPKSKTSWNSFETNSYDQNWTKVPKISWSSFKPIGFRLKLTKLHKNPIFDHC